MLNGRAIRILFEWLGGSYHKELNINLASRDDGELFRWFVASMLYGARISSRIASKTFMLLDEAGLTDVYRLRNADWNHIVELLDEGGYTRYDFKTADKLQEASKNLINYYNGSLNKLHERAESYIDLVNRIIKLAKGIGPLTAQIFLRELREIWSKATPPISRFTVDALVNLGHPSDRPLEVLKRIWSENSVRGYTLCDLEAALLKLAKDYCNKNKCKSCRIKDYCTL